MSLCYPSVMDMPYLVIYMLVKVSCNTPPCGNDPILYPYNYVFYEDQETAAVPDPELIVNT